MNQDFKTVVAKIKYVYNITQDQIAQKLGMSRTYLSSISGGKFPYTRALEDKLRAEFPHAFDESIQVVEQNPTSIPVIVERLTTQIEHLVAQNKMLIEQNQKLMEKLLERQSNAS